MSVYILGDISFIHCEEIDGMLLHSLIFPRKDVADHDILLV